MGNLNFNPHLFLSQLEVVNPNSAIKDTQYKMIEKAVPYSLTEEEGIIMYNFIKKFKLKSGFEIATAFGVSTMYLGNAFKEVGGKLTSIDAYVEELFENHLYGDIYAEVERIKMNISQGIYPIGYVYAKNMIESYNLEETVDLKIGLSPDDVTEVNGEIEFAFIDGGHHGMQPLHDTVAALSLMKNEKKVLFFHDNINNPSIDLAIQFAKERFKTTPIIFDTKQKLTLVTNMNIFD
ncbi:class I SAM-dependent methyltransferase [Ureibacillus chungkukjangi]|uniref:class I SAM-dependent methyltransferase n=1 Tax=Ureibacillus chungkukjangi TaxID=1202712 RepID=UPI00384CDBB0